MHVAALWRDSVKSLGGESLQTVQLTADGVVGDRAVHVRSSRGLLTGRTRHDLLTASGGTGPDGVLQVAGRLVPTDEQPAHLGGWVVGAAPHAAAPGPRR